MSQRVPITTVSLKDRIAALGLQDRSTTQPNPPPQSTTALLTPASNLSSISPGSSSFARVRDKAAQFEAIGGTPVPRGSFGLGAPPTVQKLKKSGELYGNRIPSAQPLTGRQWPPGSPGSGYGSDIGGTSPGMRSVSMPSRTSRANSIAGSDDGATNGNQPIDDINPDRKDDDTASSVAKIEVVPPTPAFPPPEISRRPSVVPSSSVVEEVPELEDQAPSALESAPEVPQTPPQPASDPVSNNFSPVHTPSVRSHVSSPLASVEEEPVSLDDLLDPSPSSGRPIITRTPEEFSESVTPDAASPTKKKKKATRSRKASPSLTTSPPLRPLRRAASTSGGRRQGSISSNSGTNGIDSVFTAPPVQGEDVSGGIYLSSALETVGLHERNGLGLHVGGEEYEGQEEGIEDVKREEVPLDFEAAVDELLDDYAGTSESQKQSQGSYLAKERDRSVEEYSVDVEQPHTHDRSTSSSTSDHKPADPLDSLADSKLSAQGQGPEGALDILTLDGGSAVTELTDTGQVPLQQGETEAQQVLEPIKEADVIRVESDTQTNTKSPDRLFDQSEPKNEFIIDSLNSQLSLPYKDSISRSGLVDTGTASPARVLRELKQLGMEKRSSIVVSPTRRASVLSVVLPLSPEKASALRDSSDKSPEGGQPSPSKTMEMKSTSPLSMGQNSTPTLASPLGAQSPILVATPAISSDHPGDEAEYIDRQLPATPLTSGSIAFPTPPTSASTSTGLFSRRSTDDFTSQSRTHSFDSRRSSSSSNRHSIQHYAAPPMPPPSIPLPPIPMSPPPPTPPPKDVPVSFGQTPVPPSFRELYSSGRLPPASRGPGMHQPAQGRPLLGRTISLSNRPLPSLPSANIPRRSSSAFVSSGADRRVASAHVPSLQTVPPSPYPPLGPPPNGPLPMPPGPEKAYPTLSPYNVRPRTASSPLAPRLHPLNASVLDVKPRSQEDPTHSREMTSLSVESDQTARHYLSSSANAAPSSYRSPSPTPSNCSDSQAGTVSSIFSQNFDRRIFDAFPEVPRQLPDPMVPTKQGGLTHLASTGPMPIIPMGSPSEAPMIAVTAFPSEAETDRESPVQNNGYGRGIGLGHPSTSSKSTVSMPQRPVSLAYGEDTSEAGGWPGRQSPVRERKKSTTRPLIPTWYDDDDYDESEAGWASVSVVRRRIA